MKNAKYVIIAIACICVICAGFFLFSQGNQVNEKDLTEIEKVIVYNYGIIDLLYFIYFSIFESRLFF